MSDGRGHSGDKDATLTPSDRQRQREQRARELEQLQQKQVVRMDGRPSVLHSHLSESPPTSSSGFLAHENPAARVSPALAPLAIPSGQPNPSLNLTEPTPQTARPTARKGQGTLDLEHAFGLLVQNEGARTDDPRVSSNFFLASHSSPGGQIIKP